MHQSVKLKAFELGAVVTVERTYAEVIAGVEVLDFSNLKTKDEIITWCIDNNKEIPSVSWVE